MTTPVGTKGFGLTLGNSFCENTLRRKPAFETTLTARRCLCPTTHGGRTALSEEHATPVGPGPVVSVEEELGIPVDEVLQPATDNPTATTNTLQYRAILTPAVLCAVILTRSPRA